MRNPFKHTQLRMVRDNLENLKPMVPPEGYEIRTFRDGDEAAWAEIIKAAFGSRWDAERCKKELTSLPQFRPEGLFFAVYDDMPVGTACAWVLKPDEKEAGIVHMLGVLSEHRGNGLGYTLCLSILHYFRENSFKRAYLNTDDFRLSAIKTYLNLGFKPEYMADNHEARWNKVFGKIDKFKKS